MASFLVPGRKTLGAVKSCIAGKMERDRPRRELTLPLRTSETIVVTRMSAATAAARANLNNDFVFIEKVSVNFAFRFGFNNEVARYRRTG